MPTMTKTSRAAAEAAHRDIERMIYQLCWTAVIRWGGDWDEYLSTANVAFMLALGTWDRGKGAFSTHLWWCVRGALLHARDREARHHGHEVPAANLVHLPTRRDRHRAGDDEEMPATLADVPARRERPLTSLLRDLGDDARAIVALLADLPRDLRLLRRVGVGGRGSVPPDKARRVVAWYLHREGWSLGRIAGAFAELRESLT